MIRFYAPAALAAIPLAIAAAGVVAGAASQFAGAEAANSQGKAEAAAAEQDAAQQAGDLRFQGAQEQIQADRAIRDEQRQNAMDLSRARAIAAGQGWAGGVNAQSLMASIAGESALRQSRARFDTATTIGRLNTAADRTTAAGRAAASYARYRGRAEASQARRGAIGALLTGSGSLLSQGASAYADYKARQPAGGGGYGGTGRGLMIRGSTGRLGGGV